MTEQKRIAILLYKYLHESLSEAEALELEEWKRQKVANQQFFETLQNEGQLGRWIAEDYPDKLKEMEERIYAKVIHEIPVLRIIPVYRRPWVRVAAAASVLLITGLSYWLTIGTAKMDEAVNPLAQVKKVIDFEAPKITKATITLANGKMVPVDNLTTLSQNNVQLSKTDEGKIIYTGDANEAVYNTLNNPRGSKVIDMILGDGSHVWLNAGSSVTYPIAFTGKERNVTLTGEAYFEVLSNPDMPFRVRKGETVITVLGTHFNVNAYDDENDIKVTLMEGSVKINSKKNERLLHPGQQAEVSSEIKIVEGADVEQVMAWKNGRFYFNNTDVKTIMRQVSRWYNVEIVYKGEPAEMLLGGVISRKENVSQLLKVLEATGKVHFVIEEDKIITTR